MYFNLDNIAFSCKSNTDKFNKKIFKYFKQYYNIDKINKPKYNFIVIIDENYTINIDLSFEKTFVEYNLEAYKRKEGGFTRLIFKNFNTSLLYNKREFIFISNNIDECYKYLRQTIRLIITLEKEKNNGFQLHCSALSIDNNGIIFAGDKGAGKTTFMSGLVIKDKCNIISNDRTLFWEKENGYYLSSWPTLFRISPGTIKSIKQLQKNLPNEYLKYMESLNDIYSINNIKYKVNIEDIEQFYESKISKISNLKMIFFPFIDINKKMKIEEINIKDSYSILYSSLIKNDKNEITGTPSQLDWLGFRDKNYSSKNSFKNLFNYVRDSKIKTFKVSGNPDFTQLYNYIINNI